MLHFTPVPPTPQVHIAETATDKVSNTSPTAASMSTDLYGMAALDACEQITERLKPVIAGLPEGSPFSAVVTVSVVVVVVVGMVLVSMEEVLLPGTGAPVGLNWTSNWAITTFSDDGGGTLPASGFCQEW